jgi:hypothetical protein
MKRLITIAILTSVLFLSGCLNPIAISVVQDAYEAALVENDRLVETYFSKDYLSEHPIEELSDELAEDVRNREGTKLMNFKEHGEGRLNPEVVQALNEKYNDEWNFVVAQTSDETIMIWIVIKGERQYSIVDGKKIDVDTYLKDVLK